MPDIDWADLGGKPESGGITRLSTARFASLWHLKTIFRAQPSIKCQEGKQMCAVIRLKLLMDWCSLRKADHMIMSY